MKTGDKVEFSSRKGLVKGIVIATKWSSRGHKVAKQMNAMLKLRGHDRSQVPEGQMVAEVADFKNDTVWTVDLYHVKAVGKVTKKELAKAEQLKYSIIANNQGIKDERKMRNLGKIADNCLENLDIGDTIEVRYRGGYWKEEIFEGFTPSRKVAFRSRATRSGKRYAWPSSVRVPA